MKNFFKSCMASVILLICVTSMQAGNLRPWEVFERSLQSSAKAANPYIDCIRDQERPYLTAQFTGTSGKAEGKTITVPGFWDGSTTWKIRFAPPCSGTWAYRTFCTDRKMAGKKGEFTVAEWSEDEIRENPARRGFIMVNRETPGAGRYFTYSDGTPYLWIGDTWWNWTDRRIRFESFKLLADTRAQQGFNIGQLFFAGNGWGQESSLLDSTYRHPDLEQIRKVEQMIEYANSRGITVWIHAWWSRENMAGNIGPENIRRWWRYVIDRLQAYNVIWVLAGEYNMNGYGGFPLSFWKDLGALIKTEDPYGRVVGVHPTPPMWEGGAGAPQWSTAEAIHEEPWLDYNQSQCGHARWCNELIPWIIKNAYAREPAKPVVVTEPWYEFIGGNPTAMDIRFGAWSAMMSGAAGHSYGGGHVWRAYLPETRSEPDAWPLDTGFVTNTLDYPGAVSVGFMGKYLRQLEWWKLSPHPELVLENPSPYCLADPGHEYLFYLRYGGSIRVDLQAVAAHHAFHVKWTDLTNGRTIGGEDCKAGQIAEIKCPEDYPGVVNFKDWVVHLTMTEDHQEEAVK